MSGGSDSSGSLPSGADGLPLRERLRRVFSSSRLFRTIPPECLEALNPHPLSLAEGQLLFEEGDSAEFAYVIESGI
ncbi:MAG: hypothetical protein NTW83_04145, partial [Cyanobacteria bacterium]|nr:hypothetical protein [Cyanobacteriota bacterium]